MKRLHRNIAISAVVAGVAVIVGVALLVAHQQEEVETLGQPLLRRLQKNNVIDNTTLKPMPIHAWPYKAANMEGTGTVNRTALRNLTAPAWTFYIDTLIFTTPIIDDLGNIYFAPMNGMVYSLDLNGNQRWRHKLLGSQPPTPALVEDLLIVSDSLGYAYGLNLDNGKVRWVREIANLTGTDAWAVITSSELAIFSLSDDEDTNTSQIIAVEAASGEDRWVFQLSTTMHNVAPVFVDGGSALIFADSDAGLYKLDAASGRLLWSVAGYNWTIPEGPAKVYRSLAGGVTVHEGLVYSTGNPTFAAGIARAHRVDTGELVWQSKKFKEHTSNSAAIAMIDGVPTFICGYGFTPPLHLTLPTARKPFISTLVALDARTGEVLWSFKTPKWDNDVAAGQPFLELGVPNIPNSWSAATIGADGTVYATWMGGILYAIDGRSGRVVSLYPTGEGGQSQPIIGHYGELVVACGSHVMLFRDCGKRCQPHPSRWFFW
mmetsp:Transcript_96283/g.310885  ORF Transcript_96283/g.310885 Transcript_96283/m.310885 type:complete len:489 (+) Transcript_96283:65-1531(+)